jgi:hypothetical protein
MGLHIDQLCGKLKKPVVSGRLLISSVFAGGNLSGSEGKTSLTLPNHKSADKHSSKETGASGSNSKRMSEGRQEVSDSLSTQAIQDDEPSGGSTELCGEFELPTILTNNACQTDSKCSS